MSARKNQFSVFSFRSSVKRETDCSCRHYKLLITCILLISLAWFGLVYSQTPEISHPAAANHHPGTTTGHSLERLDQDIDQDLQQGMARIQPWLDRYGYAALVLCIVVEGMGILAPGQTMLIAAAITAAKGDLNIAWVVTWAFLAALLGNSLGYLIGRYGGRALLSKFKINERHLQRMEGYFTRYGKGVVLFARFFDGLRQLNGIVAGMLEMPWRAFMPVNLLGAILWSGFWGLGTYFLDREIGRIHSGFRQVEPWVAALSLVNFLTLIIYLFWQRGKKK
jgi:membrane protein DedA with SNARE-associated domain